MSKKKRIISEGDLFTVPLENGKYAIGLVAALAKNTFLAYYFNDVLDSNLISNFRHLDNRQVALIQMVSILGLTSGKWQIIGKSDSFNSSDWPIPRFKQHSILLNCYFGINYNSYLEEIKRETIDEHTASNLYPSGLAGYVYAENILSKILD